ncbi:MAG: DUF1329 domain-containing protein [Betaproteobacteria bacterium]
MVKFRRKAWISVCLGALAGSVSSATLTSAGAEQGANKDGSIPAWQGAAVPEAGWSYGKNRGDYSKHRGEKPLAVIDASNVDKYADKLTPGQVQLLKTVKGYTMPVYTTHRSCGFPDFVIANTKAGAGKAKIGADGWSLEDAVLPSIPFPEPKSGIEAMWNFLARYQGAGIDIPEGTSFVSAAPGSSKPIVVSWNEVFYFPWGKKGAFSPKDAGGFEYGLYYAYTQPAALAGQALTQRYNFASDTESFYYFPGQRRVRRLPSYGYDAPLIGFENQYPADMFQIFSGAPDRFDWKIVGKKEVYVPYNNFEAYNFRNKVKDVFGPTFVKAEVRRYELHRVWVIEGNVKSGVRHMAPKKTVYLDEDTWQAVVGDDFDAQGKIWKSKEIPIVPIWELGACQALATQVFYDLSSGRYVVDNTPYDTSKDFKFMSEHNDPRMNSNYFTAEKLRAISER